MVVEVEVEVEVKCCLVVFVFLVYFPMPFIGQSDGSFIRSWRDEI